MPDNNEYVTFTTRSGADPISVYVRVFNGVLNPLAGALVPAAIYAKERVKEQTLAGISASGISGFIRYSPKYAKRKGQSNVDLFGRKPTHLIHMLDAIVAKVQTEGKLRTMSERREPLSILGNEISGHPEVTTGAAYELAYAAIYGHPPPPLFTTSKGSVITLSVVDPVSAMIGRVHNEGMLTGKSSSESFGRMSGKTSTKSVPTRALFYYLRKKMKEYKKFSEERGESFKYLLIPRRHWFGLSPQDVLKMSSLTAVSLQKMVDETLQPSLF